MADTSLVIALENSPTRCTAITSKGQCVNESQPKATVCAMHGRVIQARNQRKNIEELYSWKFQEDARKFSQAGVMSLRAEVSILRVCLQKLTNTCQTPNQVVLNIGPISKLTADIGSLLSVMDRINMNSGNLLDADDIIQIAQEIVQAISLEISDSESLARLAQAIESIIKSKFTPEQVADHGQDHGQGQ